MQNQKWHTWVWIKWKAGTPTNAWETWKGNPSITKAWSTVGDWDCCISTNISDPEKLEEFVWKNIRTNQWVDGTSTSFVKEWW